MDKLLKFGNSIIFTLIIGSYLVGQTGAQAAGPSECPQPEFRNFLPLIGKWKVKWTNRISPGEYENTNATAQIEKDPVGCVLTEHFFGTVKGKKFNMLVLLNFGNQEGLQRVLLDSEHGQLVQFTGKREEDVVRFGWERDMGSRKMLLKDEYRELKKDAFISETFLSTDSGKTWNRVQYAVYKRD